jgi:FixJ family two-component response regulator
MPLRLTLPDTHLPQSPRSPDRPAPPELRRLFELAARLEATVQGPEKQGLARQLATTLADLSRRLQGQDQTLDGRREPSSVNVDLGLYDVPKEGESPHWADFLEDLTSSGARSSPLIAVVDHDPDFRTAIRDALEAEGLTVETFASCDLFLRAWTSGEPACLIIDSSLPGMNGLQLLRTLNDHGRVVPVIIVAGPSEVPTAVRALKAGAVDFLEKPIRCTVLLASLERALVMGREAERSNADHVAAANRLLDLTPRQRQVMEMILAGHPSKNIAADIGVSQRTVESHRAEVMRRTGAKSMPALARLAAAAIAVSATPLSFHFERSDVVIETASNAPLPFKTVGRRVSAP